MPADPFLGLVTKVKVSHPLNALHRNDPGRLRGALSRGGFLAALLWIVASAPGLAGPPQVTIDAPSAADTKIAPWLEQRLGTAHERVEMLVVIDGEADLSPASARASRPEKSRVVYDTLRSRSLARQEPVIAWLAQRGITVEQRFWLVNAILIKADQGTAHALASRKDVARIVGNPQLRGFPEAEISLVDEGAVCKTSVPTSSLDGSLGNEAGVGEPTTAPSTVEYGPTLINAPSVWSIKNVRGEGIVVATMDTGVQWNHPAIQPKYRGYSPSGSDHSHSWHDSVQHTTVPFDDHGHGTHVTGIEVGDDGAGNQIGVAPGARWIACRNMDHGNGTPARYLECMQWGLAPYAEGENPLTDGRPDLGADITNNSWGCPPVEGCDPFTLQEGFDNLRAAGQMTVAAAGNAGPSCGSVDDPPAIYDSVFSIGAVGSSSTLASFSSRGPVTIDGSGRLKPNVAAPGVAVRSSYPTNTYLPVSGTSMASPHATGAMALLWSAKPALKKQIRISRCYLEQSAVAPSGSPASCGGTGPGDHPNNLWGWGLIDVLAAIDLGPDGDTDGIANACDCNPLDGGAFEAPPEIDGDGFPSSTTNFAWGSLATLSGTGTLYDVARGRVSDLRASSTFGLAICLSENHSPNSLGDTDVPPAGDAFYYVVRGQNSCDTGSYGSASNGTPRSISACL